VQHEVLHTQVAFAPALLKRTLESRRDSRSVLTKIIVRAFSLRSHFRSGVLTQLPMPNLKLLRWFLQVRAVFCFGHNDSIRRWFSQILVGNLISTQIPLFLFGLTPRALPRQWVDSQRCKVSGPGLRFIAGASLRLERTSPLAALLAPYAIPIPFALIHT